MKSNHIIVLLPAVVIACFGAGTSCADAQESNESAITTKDGTAMAERFDPGRFSNPAVITNEWLPMPPGTKWLFEGTTIEDDGTSVPHRIVIHATDLTKIIGGVRCLVSYDLDFSDGELVEAELAFYAQDDDGNVWRMGEYPEEYEEGKLVATPAWLHGIEGARAGIMMTTAPTISTPGYSQGWAPAVNWTDRARVDQVAQRVVVPAGSYDDVVVIAETSQAEPNAEQLKYYARGVGNIRAGWRGTGEKTKETLELVSVKKLTPRELSEIRAKALALEKSAYKNSTKVYGTTTPAEQQPGAR